MQSVLLVAMVTFSLGHTQALSWQVQNFPPESYLSSSNSAQNWCVLQDLNGIIYVSNSDVVMAYNGKRWTAIKGSNNKRLFKLAMDPKGRVFTGGLGDLGFISWEIGGVGTFKSLLDFLPQKARNFEQIHNVVADGRGNIFFKSGKWLMMWDGTRMTCFPSKINFVKAMVGGGKVYVQSKDDGVWSYEGNEFFKIPGTERLDSLTIMGIQPGVAYKANKELLIVTLAQGIFSLEEGELQQAARFSDSLLIRNVSALHDDRIALATNAHGLAIFDKRTSAVEFVNEGKGLLSNALLFPSQDLEGGIWVAGDLGLSRIRYPSVIGKVPTGSKKLLMALKVLDYNGQRYVGTVDGCWQLSPDADSPKFTKIGGIEDLVSGLERFQDGLLIGSSTFGIFWLRGNQLTKISTTGTIMLLALRSQPGRILVGREPGLACLNWDNSRWEEKQITEVRHAVGYLSEAENGDVWATKTSVSRLRFPSGPNTEPFVTTFDSTHGFTSDHGYFEPFAMQGKVFFGTDRGIFRFDEQLQQLVADSTFGSRFADQGYSAHLITKDLKGQIWLNDGKRTGVLRPTFGGKWIWDDLPLRFLEDKTFYSIAATSDSLIWIGTTSELFWYDPRPTKNYHVPFNTLWDKIVLNDTISIFGREPDDIAMDSSLLQESPTFLYTHNNIAFSYTATSYEYPEKTTFSYWLEGREAGWSEWVNERDKAYTDLPEGTYTFHARSKNLYDTLGTEAAYTFTILPPWYRTWWAYLGYFVLGVGVVVIIVRWQVGRANRKQEAARELERQQQRAILQTTVETQESERIRIARDLHDEVGALLSTVKMSLKLSQRKLAKDGVETSLDESTEMLDSAIGSVRQISHDLLPPSLESLGLCAALAQLADKTAQLSGIPFECVLLHEPPRLEIRTELTLYRVVQELISNSLKHSQATERRLDFSFRDGVFTLVFRDNGVGFDLAKVKESGAGLGLRGMESRVDALGGKLRFETARGQGFLAEISLRV